MLGALMIDKDAFPMVSDILKPKTFYEPRNQKVFQAVQALAVAEKPIDIMTVIEELKHQGTLEEVGGPAYIVELSSHVVSSAHIEYHSRILAQKSLARELIAFSSVVATKAFDESVDVDELMQEAESLLFELARKNMRKDYTQIDPVLMQAVDILQKAAANKGGLTGIPTGFTKLDEMTSGWQPSDLVIIAGRPAMGKTSFALSLAKNVAVDYQMPIAFFSLEMNNVQLVNRLISNVCEISGNKILNGQLDELEWKRLDTNIRRLQGAPIYIDDTPGMSIFELSTKAKRLVREKGVKDIPVIALSQLNRTVENRDGLDGKRPQLSDLRESGAIEQDADIVIFVHRPEYYHLYQDEHGNDLHGMAQIIIAKHRKGATGDVLLTFRGEYTRFENPEDSRLVHRNTPVSGEIIGSKINGEDQPPMDGPLPF